MEEHERHAVHLRTLRRQRHLAVGEVPIGDVVTLVAQHVHAVAHPRNEIHPLLVDEQPVAHVHHAAAFEPRLPPLQEGVELRMPLQGEKAQVVRPCAQHVDLGGLALVVDRTGEMRGEHAECAGIERRFDLVHAPEHPDVRIEIDRAPVALLAEEPVEEPRLCGGVELQDRVAEAKREDVGNVEVGDLDDAKALGGRIEMAVDAIGEQHHAIPVRMRALHGIHERPREVEIVLRANGADDLARARAIHRTSFKELGYGAHSRRGGGQGRARSSAREAISGRCHGQGALP